jgi:hypothetical protein
LLPNILQRINHKLIGPEGLSRLMKRLECDSFYRENIIPPFGSGKYILIDGLWDNPNHWNRVQMISRILQEKYQADPIGLLLPKSRWPIKRSLKAVGATMVMDLFQQGKFAREAARITEKILASVKSGDDFLALHLPSDVPASRLYDTILKRQRNEDIDLSHPGLFDQVNNFIQACLNVEDIFNTFDIKAVVSSHSISTYHSSLSWIALKRKAPFFLTDNFAGTIRCSNLWHEDQYYSPNDSPDTFFRDHLGAGPRRRLVENGKKILNDRISSKGIDLSGRLAYAEDKEILGKKELYDRMGFDHSLPLACIMMCNWFDFPHTNGMTNFANIVDWITFTVQEIAKDTSANWVIKPHPAEHRWYGGATVEEVVGELPSHVKIFPHDLHSLCIRDAASAIVTPFGTAGIEYTAMGKNVLLADRSFYSDWEFCQLPTSREDYKKKLHVLPHLPEPGLKTVADAFLYISLYMGRPVNVPERYFYPCDTGIYEIFDNLPGFLRDNEQNIKDEMELMKGWVGSGLKSFNSYKTALAAGWVGTLGVMR